MVNGRRRFIIVYYMYAMVYACTLVVSTYKQSLNNQRVLNKNEMYLCSLSLGVVEISGNGDNGVLNRGS